MAVTLTVVNSSYTENGFHVQDVREYENSGIGRPKIIHLLKTQMEWSLENAL
jgi:hypothetical protein